MTDLQSIRNFAHLSHWIGTSGQPTRDQFETIAKAGYCAVVNLALPDHPDSLSDEASIVTSLGLAYHHIPVPWDAPLLQHLIDFASVMDLYSGTQSRSRRNNARPVFVHCIMNYRVSAFCYRYLTDVCGFPPGDARSPILMEWTPEGVWAEVVGDSRWRIVR